MMFVRLDKYRHINASQISHVIRDAGFGQPGEPQHQIVLAQGHIWVNDEQLADIMLSIEKSEGIL